MIGFVRGVIAFLAPNRNTYCQSSVDYQQNLQKFVTNSYIIKKLCFKLHPLANLLYYCNKIATYIFSKRDCALEMIMVVTRGFTLSCFFFSILRRLLVINITKLCGSKYRMQLNGWEVKITKLLNIM